MPLSIAVFGFFIIKGLILLPFYFKQVKPLLLVAIVSSLAIVPLITLLYHETTLNFWLVYFVMILGDIFIFYYLIQPNWAKAIPASILISTIAIIFFYLGNG